MFKLFCGINPGQAGLFLNYLACVISRTHPESVWIIYEGSQRGSGLPGTGTNNAVLILANSYPGRNTALQAQPATILPNTTGRRAPVALGTLLARPRNVSWARMAKA